MSPVERSPPSSDEKHDKTDRLVYPNIRLAVIARLRQAIEELLPDAEINEQKISELLDNYKLKTAIFVELCSEELEKTADPAEISRYRSWFEMKRTELVEFSTTVSERIRKSSEAALGCSASAVSVRSKTSSVSSARVKLAEMRSKLNSDKAFLKEKQMLEAEEIRIKQSKEELMIRQRELEQRDLEQQLADIELTEGSVAENKTAILSGEGLLSSILQQQTSMMSSLLEAQKQSFLPKNFISTFDGRDIIQFRPFKLSFQRMIETHCTDDACKFHYLDLYTSGAARELVRSCQGNNYTTAYRRAMELLEERYGNSYLTSQAYINKLYSWPNIQNDDAGALDRLSLFVTSCSNLMNDVSGLDQLNHHKEMKIVIDKLPLSLRNSWRDKVIRLEDEHQVVKFVHLEKFIRQQARAWNQPVFGDTKNAKPSRLTSRMEERKSLSTRVGTNEQQDAQACLCCRKVGSHHLDDCFFFKKKDYSTRRKFVIDNELCFGCLRPGHQSKECPDRLECRVCHAKHPSSLHIEKSSDSRQSARPSTSGVSAKVMTQRSSEGRQISPAVPVLVRIRGSGKTIQTYMALDWWSTDCFISSKLLDQLGQESGNSHMFLTTFGGLSEKVATKSVSELQVLSLSGSDCYDLPVAHCTKIWPFSHSDLLTISDVGRFEHMKDIPFSFVPGEIGLLVGSNASELMQPLEIVSGEPNEPFAVRFPLGWTSVGSFGNRENCKYAKCHRVNAVSNAEDIERNIDRLFASEFRDLEPEVQGHSFEDKLFLKKVEDSCRKLPNGQYEIALPFRCDTVKLPNNFRQASACLSSLKKRFLSNKLFFQDYKNFIDNMIKCGYLELVSKNDVCNTTGKTLYLIHHGVYHKTKNKIRVVFDCSRRNGGTSLNDLLLKGPDLTNNLSGVLLRFRQEAVAVMSDIESMFFQVKVPSAHADFQRILWFPDGDLDSEPVSYRLTSHTFGAVSSPSVANFALKQSVIDYGFPVSDKARNTINRDAYVDDVIFSVQSSFEAVEVIKDIRNITSLAGFNLKSFVSNSRDVLSTLDPKLLSKNLDSLKLDLGDLPSDQALGVSWDAQTDKLSPTVNIKDFNSHTRRSMLSIISSIFDPLGLVNPVVVSARALFQETCRRKLGWDENLPDDILRAWFSLLASLPKLQSFSVDRCLKGNLTGSCEYELHIFCDGSLIAYGAVAYLRSVSSNGGIQSCLIASKARQTPVSNSTLRTVPRIELNSAKLGVILSQIVIRELDFQFLSTYFWSDSETVLKYINSDSSRFQRFVENRVTFIRSYTEPDQWFHVPGSLNVADLLSRGCSTDSLCKNNTWEKGPDFLMESKEFWPPRKTLEPLADNDSEVKKQGKIALVVSDSNRVFSKLLDCSSWLKILFRVSVFLSFLAYLRNKVSRRPFSLDSITHSEVVIWRYVQSLCFSDQIKVLTTNGNLAYRDPLVKLLPFLDSSGVLRVGGRISRCKGNLDNVNPIILNGKNSIVQTMIRYVHVKIGHMGRNYLISHLQQKYWILNINTIVKRILKSCLLCRKLNSRPVETLMSELPECRVIGDRPPFFSTGVDYFGPFLASRGRGKASEKRYGVLFTCLASRAVHLEVASSLTGDSFVHALRRFTSRRGQVRKMYSDNGTNIVGGSRELQAAIAEWNKIAGPSMLHYQIEWNFSPPAASNFGGVWEREIRTARKILLALISEQPRLMTDELLTTLFCEVEAIMNSRPLTPISDDVRDLRCITPNHLLRLEADSEPPPGHFDSNDNYARRNWKRIQHLANSFWVRWRREYLRGLQERQKWTRERESLKIGDLVLVTDVLLPRNQWCMGRILEVFPGGDGRIRSVKLRVAKHVAGKNLQISSTEIERPVNKLVFLSSS